MGPRTQKRTLGGRDFRYLLGGAPVGNRATDCQRTTEGMVAIEIELQE
ncbi:hypothetical protein [Halorussus lipolyticus]|nr:hypothetical protein [Halorussus sp. DT80]